MSNICHFTYHQKVKHWDLILYCAKMDFNPNSKSNSLLPFMFHVLVVQHIYNVHNTYQVHLIPTEMSSRNFKYQKVYSRVHIYVGERAAWQPVRQSASQWVRLQNVEVALQIKMQCSGAEISLAHPYSTMLPTYPPPSSHHLISSSCFNFHPLLCLPMHSDGVYSRFGHQPQIYLGLLTIRKSMNLPRKHINPNLSFFLSKIFPIHVLFKSRMILYLRRLVMDMSRIIFKLQYSTGSIIQMIR